MLEKKILLTIEREITVFVNESSNLLGDYRSNLWSNLPSLGEKYLQSWMLEENFIRHYNSFGVPMVSLQFSMARLVVSRSSYLAFASQVTRFASCDKKSRLHQDSINWETFHVLFSFEI